MLMISDFLNFHSNAFEIVEFWFMDDLIAILRLYKGKSPLFLIYSFCCCLVKLG